MKKRVFSFLIILITALMTFTLVGCEEEKVGKVELSNADYGFITADTVSDDSMITLAASTKPTTLDVVKNYYLLISVDMTLTSEGDERGSVTMSIEIDDTEFVSGHQYISYGSKTTETSIKSSTGQNGINITTTNSAPEDEDEVQNVLFVILLTTLKVGDTPFNVNFESEDINLKGDTDGFSKTIVIAKVTLTAPEISFDEATLYLTWTNVANAGYYKLFSDGEVVYDGETQVIYLVDEYTATGAVINWDISSYISGTHIITLQAFNDSTNFNTSNYSNEVSVTL